MKEIEDTTKSPHTEWLMGGNPGAIERQEKEGQMQLVQSCQLPAKINHPMGAWIEKEYEKMGIEIIGKGNDELFFNVKLPEGWRLRATEHPMWSHLIDESGKVRASIFYKAAFYDRDAFINIGE